MVFRDGPRALQLFLWAIILILQIVGLYWELLIKIATNLPLITSQQTCWNSKNVIVEMGLALVDFHALSVCEFVLNTSTNPTDILGL